MVCKIEAIDTFTVHAPYGCTTVFPMLIKRCNKIDDGGDDDAIEQSKYFSTTLRIFFIYSTGVPEGKGDGEANREEPGLRAHDRHRSR
jgi:hypothetical protein